MKLYIIGNGFDIAHNIHSSYSDFCAFVRDNHPYDFERIGHLFFDDANVLWSDFERNLTHLNILRLVNENIDIWKHQNSRDIENTFDTEFSNLKTYFMEWVISKFNHIHGDRIYDLSANDFYVNFNYTNTLHTVYGIPNTRILYIHENSVENHYLMPIVGHGEPPEEITRRIEDVSANIEEIVRLSFFRDLGIYPVGETTEVIKNEINHFLNSLRKNTDDVMQRHHDFFENLGEQRDVVTDVIILGHSLADVDIPYFKRIDELLNVDTSWHIDYYPNDIFSRDAKLRRFREVMDFDAAAYD